MRNYQIKPLEVTQTPVNCGLLSNLPYFLAEKVQDLFNIQLSTLVCNLIFMHLEHCFTWKLGILWLQLTILFVIIMYLLDCLTTKVLPLKSLAKQQILPYENLKEMFCIFPWKQLVKLLVDHFINNVFCPQNTFGFLAINGIAAKSSTIEVNCDHFCKEYFKITEWMN